jgi:hypothetical protein
MPSKRPNKSVDIKIAPGHTWMMPPKHKMYVSAYRVTRHFGGHEEGGWYYDWYEHIATYPRRVKSLRLPMVQEKMREMYVHLRSSHGRQGRYSVRGGADIVIVNERTAGESRSLETPHYE